MREYQIYLTEERKMAPETVNCFTAAAKFLYQTTLELPWSDRHFVRARVAEKLPVVLSDELIDLACSTYFVDLPTAAS